MREGLLWEFMPSEKRERPEFSFSPPCEDAVRRRPSASHEEGPHQNPVMMTAWSWTSSLQNLRNKCYFSYRRMLWQPKLIRTPGLHFKGSAGICWHWTDGAGEVETRQRPLHQFRQGRLQAWAWVAAGSQSWMEETCHCKQTPLTHQPGVLKDIFLLARFLVYLFEGPSTGSVFFPPQSDFGRCFNSSPKHVLLFQKWRFLTP